MCKSFVLMLARKWNGKIDFYIKFYGWQLLGLKTISRRLENVRFFQVYRMSFNTERVAIKTRSYILNLILENLTEKEEKFALEK